MFIRNVILIITILCFVFACGVVYAECETTLDDVRILGRSVKTNGKWEFNWPMSGIEFETDGKNAYLYIAKCNRSSYINVSVDNSEVCERIEVSKEGWVKVADNLSDGEHIIKVTRSSEGYEGILAFSYVKSDGTYIKPTLPKTRKIEFNFLYDNFAVVIVRISDIDNYSEDEKSIVYYAINNMADEIISTLYVYEKLIDTSDNMVFVVNVEDDNEEAFIEDTKFVCTLLNDVMTKEFSIGVDISISSLKRGIESLSNSYNQALTALMASSGSITDYRDIQTNRALKMIADIEEYIDAHYMNNNLSNTLIADEFNITGQYLSVLFKKYRKENLQNYIARVRVEYAKELLKNNKYTVFQIANMVGYSNDIGFIRVFKKLEGITPGKFRQINTGR